jgi:hypothetical protein
MKIKAPYIALFSLTGAVITCSLACTTETRTPFGAADSGASTEPDPPPVPTTSSTRVTPEKPTPDSGSTVPDEDCKKAAPSNVCGVVPQCGCAAGHTCDVTDTKGTTSCITAGNAPMGQPCTATAGCALGLTCIFGTCHAFCDDPTSACTQPGTGACSQIKMQNDTAVPNLAVCRVACAPHDPASCGGKTNAGIGVCFVDDDGGTDCQAGGSRAEHQTCSPTDECGPALVCTTVSAASTCKRWCRVGQNDCGTGKTCTGFQTAVTIGTVEYGACP